MDKDILILSQTVFKGFMEKSERLPENDQDVEYLKTAILKVYKAGYLAQREINKLK